AQPDAYGPLRRQQIRPQSVDAVERRAVPELRPRVHRQPAEVLCPQPADGVVLLQGEPERIDADVTDGAGRDLGVLLDLLPHRQAAVALRFGQLRDVCRRARAPLPPPPPHHPPAPRGPPRPPPPALRPGHIPPPPPPASTAARPRRGCRSASPASRSGRCNRRRGCASPGGRPGRGPERTGSTPRRSPSAGWRRTS